MDTHSIENPRLWRLSLLVSRDSLHAVATSTVADSSLIYKRMPLDTTLPLHKALESTIYANDDLLADYGSTSILADMTSYTLLPSGSDIDPADIAEVTQIGADGDTALITNTDTTGAGADIVWTFPEQASHFLARTFRNAPQNHAMSVLLTYFHRQAQSGNRAKVYLHLSDGSPRRVNIVMFDASGKLVMATTKEWEADTDVLYYALSIAQGGDFKTESDEMLICGDGALRMAVTPLLSRYVRNVMPLIFPSAALRAGLDAFKAPFPSIIQPLCE